MLLYKRCAARDFFVFQYGFTALILAAGMGSQAMVELLVGGRPDLDVNIVEANSCSALMIACMHGYIQVPNAAVSHRPGRQHWGGQLMQCAHDCLHARLHTGNAAVSHRPGRQHCGGQLMQRTHDCLHARLHTGTVKAGNVVTVG